MSPSNRNLVSTVDLERAVTLVMQMLAIAGPSGQEQKIIRFISTRLRRAGVAISAIKTDQAHRSSTIGGQIGNLIVKLSASPDMSRYPRRMLCAHVDTVPLCVGCKPLRRSSRIVSADPTTALGADNRAGATVLLWTVQHILKYKLPHPPLTFLWPVQEEVGLQGARYVNLAMLGRPNLAFNFDGGSSASLAIGATGAYSMTIHIEGIAAHAGMHPDHGVSAITIVGLAIASLQRNGWLGQIHKRGALGGRGTSNIGNIEAAGATNVVCRHVRITAEARSDDRRFRKRILVAISKALHDAADRVRNIAGASGKVTITHQLDYESFLLKKNEPCVKAAEAAIHHLGLSPKCIRVAGGFDANWLHAHGVAAVTLGSGMESPHTVHETLNLYDFQQSCRIALLLATDAG